jgi:cytochrome c heme-lyase
MPSHQACPVINKNDKSSPASSSSATADPSDKWIYPSEQQYFNAVTRKGWKNVKAEDVPMIVKIHNEVREGRTFKENIATAALKLIRF